jgi:hypothetical protein
MLVYLVGQLYLLSIWAWVDQGESGRLLGVDEDCFAGHNYITITAV